MFARLGLNTTAPYHLFIYSLVFGASTFHSFVVSPIAFKHLKREEFSNLQNKVFPLYFIGQTAGPILLGLTAPFKLCPFGLGLLSVSAIAGALNYFVMLPWCKNIKEQRNKLQKELGADETSEELAELNKQFGFAHGMSSLANLVSIISITVYGAFLTRGLSRV